MPLRFGDYELLGESAHGGMGIVYRARWLLADRSTRTVSPFCVATVPEYVSQCLNAGTLASLEEAALLSPTNPLALARLARQVIAQPLARPPRRAGEADFLSRRALELGAGDAEIAEIRAKIAAELRRGDRPE